MMQTMKEETKLSTYKNWWKQYEATGIYEKDDDLDCPETQID